MSVMGNRWPSFFAMPEFLPDLFLAECREPSESNPWPNSTKVISGFFVLATFSMKGGTARMWKCC